MCKILRWIGYAATAVGAILIIISVIGGFCHHGCTHAQPHIEKCSMHHSGCDKDVVKTDSISGSNKPCCSSAVAKTDSCCAKKETSCSPANSMNEKGCSMEHEHGSILELAISLLLLAMALFMISKKCCCKCKDGKCDCKEEKKEA